ncbi:cryptochrome/photolyase family protein [bacterium]|nr:cryptochrome/photolyase family protein [bacterium]
MRHLVLVLGDQLDRNSAAFDDFSGNEDSVWMAETPREVTHVWCHKLRIALFFSAMRHFRDELAERDCTVHYHALTRNPSEDFGKSFSEILSRDLKRFKPEKLVVVHPGDYRVLDELKSTADSCDVALEVRSDRHFYSQPEEFAEYAEGKKDLRLEYFYRWLRKKHNILVESDGSPTGGDWNYDHDNRESFNKSGPESGLKPRRFRPDETTQEVIALVESRFADHPGSLEHFDLPVTHTEARTKLREFIKHGLPNFGEFEDAMWTGETYLYHSHLSACLNLKLLNPRECIELAVEAYENGDAPLNSVEGFVRQILGWREFVRGIYWTHMPEYAEKNYFDHDREVPSFFWDGETDMRCVRESMSHVVNHGYAHHIHRLMVLGNLSQTVGVDPLKFHEWHMAMYLDAIDWVSLPNTLGMSQFGDGGIVGTKPYCSSGNYINKMSNFCSECRYNYKKRVGGDACPFTTFYWDFLDRHYDRLKDNRRLNFQIKNLERLRSNNGEELVQIRERADQLRDEWYGDS